MRERDIKKNAKIGVKGNKLDFLIYNILSGSFMCIIYVILLYPIISTVLKNNISKDILKQSKSIAEGNIVTIVVIYILLIMFAGSTTMAKYIAGSCMYEGYSISISNAFWILKHPIKSFSFGWSIIWRSCIPLYGIVATLKIPMVCQCYIDNKKGSIHSKWKEASVLMKGSKLNYFGFNLSMIPWCILLLTGIGFIWVMPWICSAQAGYCVELKNK